MAAEINRCHAVCGIPVTGTMSYNLGQAAAIALYELCGRMDEIDRSPKVDDLAPVAQLDAFLDLLSKQGGPDYSQDQRRMQQLRSLFLRARPRAQELKTFFGLIKQISK